MANPRTPVAKAKVSGADVKNPGRHKERADPKVALLGNAPGHLPPSATRAWAMFKNELPWLAASDGALLEIAARVRGELMDGEDVGVTKLSMYQSVLSKLGASPVDRSRVTIGDEEQDDPESRYFN